MIDFIEVKLKQESIFNYVEKYQVEKKWWFFTREVTCYSFLKNIVYHSKRYDKLVICEVRDTSDGATGAKDIDSFGWAFHDDITKYKKFEDGSTCSNLQASFILYDILKKEGYWFRARSWFIGTLIFGYVVPLFGHK